MVSISETEFARICTGLREDRESIIRHNPIGAADEIMLWMLLSCLNSYLSLSEHETPCFAGRPNVDMYRDAVRFVLEDRREPDFDPEPYLLDLIRE